MHMNINENGFTKHLCLYQVYILDEQINQTYIKMKIKNDDDEDDNDVNNNNSNNYMHKLSILV